MAFYRAFIALFLSVVLVSTTYAGTIELTKSKAVVSKENANKRLIKGLDLAIKKEQKKPTSIEDLKVKAEKKVAKNFDKRRDLLNDIFKHQDQDKRLRVLDRKMKKLIKLDPSLSEISSEAEGVELLSILEKKAQSLDQEEANQVEMINDELSQFATTADYLLDLKSKVENDSFAKISKNDGRSIASITEYEIYVALYVLGALALIGLIYYLVISATVAIWAFSPALAIIFLLIML
ncbi:MAG: hypothetical protein CME71_10575 [Halobacteriovorax sp.]|nr:hypothetical protein [Halobacteriovorax sp.]